MAAGSCDPVSRGALQQHLPTTPLGFVLGCPSLSARCPAGRLSGQGRLGVELLHNTDRSPEKSQEKCHRGQTCLQAEQMSCVPKSEISLGMSHFETSGGEAQSHKIRYFPRKCSTLRLLAERPRNRDLPGKSGTLKDCGENFTPRWYVNSIIPFLEIFWR